MNLQHITNNQTHLSLTMDNYKHIVLQFDQAQEEIYVHVDQFFDEMQDEEKQEKLKLLIKPFILRRKKEQVAKDLPDKIESIQLVN